MSEEAYALPYWSRMPWYSSAGTSLHPNLEVKVSQATAALHLTGRDRWCVPVLLLPLKGPAVPLYPTAFIGWRQVPISFPV